MTAAKTRRAPTVPTMVTCSIDRVSALQLQIAICACHTDEDKKFSDVAVCKNCTGDVHCAYGCCMQEAACHDHGAYSMSMAQTAVLTTRKRAWLSSWPLFKFMPKMPAMEPMMATAKVAAVSTSSICKHQEQVRRLPECSKG